MVVLSFRFIPYIRMENRIILKFFVFFSLIIFAHTAVTEPYTDSLRQALDYMLTLQRNGGWAMSWAADGSAAFGEHRLRRDEIITVQPPATPGIGGVFLRLEFCCRMNGICSRRGGGDALIGDSWNRADSRMISSSRKTGNTGTLMTRLTRGNSISPNSGSTSKNRDLRKRHSGLRISC